MFFRVNTFTFTNFLPKFMHLVQQRWMYQSLFLTKHRN